VIKYTLGSIYIFKDIFYFEYYCRCIVERESSYPWSTRDYRETTKTGNV